MRAIANIILSFRKTRLLTGVVDRPLDSLWTICGKHRMSAGVPALSPCSLFVPGSQVVFATGGAFLRTIRGWIFA
jgi:hypothetical protein